MVIPDINLLLYAYFKRFPEHRRARAWWVETLNGDGEVGIAAPVLFGFLPLATSRKVFHPPWRVDIAIERVEEWFSASRAQVRLLLPGPRHLDIAFRLLRSLGTTENLTSDVQIAALAIEYQAEVHSNDTDFGRFAGLKWTNPLPR